VEVGVFAEMRVGEMDEAEWHRRKSDDPREDGHNHCIPRTTRRTITFTSTKQTNTPTIATVRAV
jgi:hypothetical protein